jgi:hypothetical protein
MGNKIQQKIRKKKLSLEFFGFIISFYHHNREKNSKRKEMATFGVVGFPKVVIIVMVLVIHYH